LCQQNKKVFLISVSSCFHFCTGNAAVLPMNVPSLFVLQDQRSAVEIID